MQPHQPFTSFFGIVMILEGVSLVLFLSEDLRAHFFVEIWPYALINTVLVEDIMDSTPTPLQELKC